MRHHLAFRNFRPAVVEAATAVFDAAPWRMEDVLNQRNVAQNFMNRVCASFRIDPADVVLDATGGPSDFDYRPALVEPGDALSDTVTMLAPPRVTLGAFSILTLFHATRVHLLAQGAAQAVSNTDPFGWSCSLFYTVKPAMFRARAREGRVMGVTAKDTYTAESWVRLDAAGFVVGDRLSGDANQWAAVLNGGTPVMEISAPLDELPDEQETDAPLFEVVAEGSYDETTDELQLRDTHENDRQNQALDSMNRDALRALAARHELPGRGSMNAPELREALRSFLGAQ